VNQQVRVIEFKPNKLQEVARWINTNPKNSRWVGVGVEIEGSEKVNKRMGNARCLKAVLESGSMEFQGRTFVLRI